MGEKAAAEKLSDFFWAGNRIARMDTRCFTADWKYIGIDELAYRKLARKAFFKIVMTVVDLILAAGILMLAVRDRHLFFEVAESIQWRIEYCEQYG